MFDFARYNIDVHVDADDAYMPLATISVLMADVAESALVYNGRELCLFRGYMQDLSAIDPNWYDPLLADEPLAQDMADFSYNELCFAVDTLYSCNGKCAIDADIKANGLDATLTQRDEVTQRIQELLKSTNKIERYMGYELLNVCLFNGHTSLIDKAYISILDQDEAANERMKQISEEIKPKLTDAGYMQTVEYLKNAIGAGMAGKQRSEIWTDGDHYHEQGDTAVLTSSSTWSCGNLFASVMHDAGIPIFGEASSGGTDMVTCLFTPDGMHFTITNCFAQMTDIDGNNIENGIPVDVELVKVNEDGTKDYSGLYDIATLSELVNEFYAEEDALPNAA